MTNATVTEDSTAVLGMADLITEEDMVTTDTAITDMVTGDLTSDDEICCSTAISDCTTHMCHEYLIQSAVQ